MAVMRRPSRPRPPRMPQRDLSPPRVRSPTPMPDSEPYYRPETYYEEEPHFDWPEYEEPPPPTPPPPTQPPPRFGLHTLGRTVLLSLGGRREPNSEPEPRGIRLRDAGQHVMHACRLQPHHVEEGVRRLGIREAGSSY